MIEERRKSKLQHEQQVEEEELKKKTEEMQAYKPHVPFSQRLQKSKVDDQFSKLLNMFKKIEINIP